MDPEFKNTFGILWDKYFEGASLPIGFYYSDDDRGARVLKASPGHRCVIADMMKAIKGESIALNADTTGCGGGKKYLGFVDEQMPQFEYFLSCGIPGKLEGERYKQSPELVREAMTLLPKFEAPSTHIVFKRWDKFEEHEAPDVIVFFAPPDVLSGLFTLANFDEAEPNGVFTPFAAGCGSAVQYPYLEREAGRPRAVLGMFDVSARPCVPADLLSFAAPWEKFVRMVENMEESFLITGSWKKVAGRIDRNS